MEVSVTTAKRPPVVTVAALLLVASAVYGAITHVPRAASIAPWLPALLVVSELTTLACAIAVWFMRCWGVYLYAGLVVAVTCVGVVALGVFSVPAFIVHVVVLAVLFYFVCLR